MKRVRIIKRTKADGTVKFVIQQKHFLFRWWWVDAWVNSVFGAECVDEFDTFNEAYKNLCYFEGKKSNEVVIYDN